MGPEIEVFGRTFQPAECGIGQRTKVALSMGTTADGAKTTVKLLCGKDCKGTEEQQST